MSGLSGLFKVMTVLLVVVLAGCSSVPRAINETPPTPPESTERYRIGVGDTLTINVWRNPELSQQVAVRPDGYISMPLMGDLRANGRHPEALADEISEAVGQVIRSPEVTVIVNNPSSHEYMDRVRVTGQVGSATSVAHRPGMTVMDLVLQAGGVNDFGAGNRATLQRVVDGETRRYAIRLTDIFEKGRMETNYVLYPGDVISVPQKRLLRGEF